MYPNADFTISLPTSAAWDRTLGWFINTDSKSLFEVAGDSTTWGNYVNSQYTLTTGAYQFNGEYLEITEETPLVKTQGGKYELKTGSSNMFCVNNIYDLAGNVAEWVLSDSDDDRYYYTRGGWYGNNLAWLPMDTQTSIDDEVEVKSNLEGYIGFRPVIYL